MKKIIFVLILVPVLTLFMFCSKSDSGNATGPKMTPGEFKVPEDPRIMIVYSYSINDDWTSAVDGAIDKLLSASPYKYDKVFMNLVPGINEKAGAQSAKIVQQQFLDYKPFVVLSVDDEAQAYFAKDLAGRNDVSVIFCGVEKDPSIYNFPVSNATGVLERPHIQQVLLHLKELVGETPKYTLLTSRGSASLNFLKVLEGMNLGLNMEIKQAITFDEWKAAAQNVGDAVLVYDAQLMDMEEEKVFQWTSQNISVPTVGFSRLAVEKGILLAEIESPVEQGTQAAQMVLGLLEGRKASQLGIRMGRKGIVLINMETAKKHNISEEKVRNTASSIVF